jgi:hypothetical protein
MALLETEIHEDPAVTEALEKISRMSQSELLKDILRHEKEVRGIDWEECAKRGEEGIADARRMASAYLAKLRTDLGVSDEDTPEFGPARNDKVQVSPLFAITEKSALAWKNASGDQLKDMVLFRLHVLQQLELTETTGGFAQLTLSMGAVAWMARAYKAYKAARLTGLTSLKAIAAGIKSVTLNVTRYHVAAFITAVIAEVLLFIMEKKAVVYMVLINMTDDDLIMNDLGLVNGKQTVQFVYSDEGLEQHNLLQKRLLIEGIPNDPPEVTYWSGMFAASKNNMALIGSLGAFGFERCPSFPNGVYVGWEIPLTALGGDNRCLVSARDEGKARAFADNRVSSQGSLYSRDSSGHATVTARMNSGGGSDGYMSVIFEKIS